MVPACTVRLPTKATSVDWVKDGPVTFKKIQLTAGRRDLDEREQCEIRHGHIYGRLRACAGSATLGCQSPGHTCEHRQLSSGSMAGAKGPRAVAMQFLAAFLANVVAMNTGYIVGWSAVSLPVLESNTTEPTVNPLDRPLTRDESSWVASLMVMASMPGPAVSSAVSRRWGYKLAGYLLGAFDILAGLTVMFAPSFPVLLLGRVLTGFGAGCSPVMSTTYISEAAQEHVRGSLGTFFALMFNAGVLVAYIVGAVAPYRIVCAGAVVLPALYLCSFFFLPESPQYLLSKGRSEEAAESLRWFRAAGHDVDAELKALQSTLSSGTVEKGHKRLSIPEFFKDRAARRGLIALVVLILNQQLSGGMTILNYVVEMLSSTGNGGSAAWSAVVVATLQFAATFLSSALVDRAGRRPLLLATNAGMAACLTALGGYFFAQASGYDVDPVWWLPASVMSFSLVLGAIGIGSLLFVILNELFSPDALPVAISVGLALQTVATTAVLKLYVVLVVWLQPYGCYWFYAVSCILSNVYILLFLPETKNRPIKDIISDLRGESKKTRAHKHRYNQVAAVESQT
ncbi:facilitated trehalose transporter Tret1-2 homolog [Schistocerca piceifrons]|uniref:facilitated trehalose transporter Tret1-2 homolog n=1 Tax=Schistocerca piceifrons TaxID=274613 RepID=UPI001F5F5A8B|nr:facilitated trehalose transporter Tret1-2 homolog [Schistocerca piceifrons]